MHYVDNVKTNKRNIWKLRNFALALKVVEDRHTSENIAIWIEKELKAWGISEMVWIRVNDGASNVGPKLTRTLSELRNSGVLLHVCSCHTMDLVAKGTLRIPLIEVFCHFSSFFFIKFLFALLTISLSGRIIRK